MRNQSQSEFVSSRWQHVLSRHLGSGRTGASTNRAGTNRGRPLHGLVLPALLALGGCASFTEPMSDMALRSEAESCARSSLCRLMIEDRPPVLTLAVNDARLCETNARIAEGILQREGLETRRFVVRLKPTRRGDYKTEAAQSQLIHTFVAARIERRWYAVDNGALPFCDRICRLDEALHGVEHISGDTRTKVTVGSAELAAMHPDSQQTGIPGLSARTTEP